MKDKKIAIVVPIYNVSDYLGECLDSLLRQGVPEKELQIILVDDGSTDNSAQVAQEYVEKHPNFFELHQFENAGLGAARNRGTKLAHAKYITYVDSDDIVAPNSYEYMLNIIEKTGSQIITGNVHRFNSEKEWANNIHTRSHLGDFENTTLSEHPELIWDSTSWNKIFLLDFLIENNLYFPEGVLYEDIPMINPAFAAAKSIDIVKRMVYLWRTREGSITESSTDAKAVLDRIVITEIALAGLKKFNASKEILDILYLKSLNLGIISMLRKEKYEYISVARKAELFSTLKLYLEAFPTQTLYQANFDKLIYFDKVMKVKTQEEFDEITARYLKNDLNISGYWHTNGEYILKSDFSDFEKIATPDDLEINPKVEDVIFEDAILKIQGYFYAKYSDMSSENHVKLLGVSALSNDGDTILENVGEALSFQNKGITAKFGYNSNHFVKDGADFNYDYSGYELKISLNDLNFENADTFTFILKAEIDGLTVDIPIKNPISGDKTRPKLALANRNALAISYSTDWNLILSLNASDVAELYLAEDESLRIKGNANKIALKSGKTTLPLKLIGGQVKISKVIQEKIQSFEKSMFHWWRFITYVNGEEKPIYYDGAPKNFQNERNLEILFANNGMATLGISYLYPIIETLDIEEDTLKLAFSLKGWMAEAQQVQIIADPSLAIIWETTKIADNLYQLSLPLTLDGFSDKEWLNFQVRLTFTDGYQTDEILRWGQKAFDFKNEWVSAGGIGWFFRSVENKEHGAFAIKRTADRVFQEKVGDFDSFLQVKYQSWLTKPLLNDHIMMSSFWGINNQFNDNPEALYRYIEKNYPNMTTVIVLKDAIRAYPEYPNSKVVSYGTEAYWYYLARSKYFVNNVNFTELPRVKRNEQIEIQTMHGTPLKTLGFDVLGDWKDSTYSEVLRKNSNWDYLTVPSDWVANYALNAFRVSPQIIKSGYPRNDTLFINYNTEEINALKRALSLPIEKKIVAYTPTWRSKDETSIHSFLNLQEFYSKIPDDTVIAIKNHHYQPWEKIAKQYTDKIILLNSDTEIEQLYHVSDALITDYSSVMFDYSLLNKPMLFWAFDYEAYVKNRGLNFDFVAEAPGPLLFQQSELSKWIEKFENIPDEFSSQIQAFKEKFGQYDKGNACELILKEVLDD